MICYMTLKKNNAAMLVLPELSAAFDTIYHRLILKRLSDIGISMALEWFQSDLDDRYQSICIKGTTSQRVKLIKFKLFEIT